MRIAFSRSQSVNLRICKMHLREDGIFQIEVKANELFSLEDAMEVRAQKERICPILTPNLWIIGEHTNPDKDAREYACLKENTSFRSADALVISSLSQRIVANFYLKVNKPPVPTRFFLTESDALKWLQQFLQEKNQPTLQ
jgi:hypothetical protein